MSRGAGKVEAAIRDLFIATYDRDRDRTFTVADLCAKVFGPGRPTRAKRVSTLRAARRVLKRTREDARRRSDAEDAAQKAAEAKNGPEPKFYSEAWHDFQETRRGHYDAAKPPEWNKNLAGWRATERADGILVFHDEDMPVRVWAVQIRDNRLFWADAEIVRVTAERVTIRYQDTLAPVNRSNLSIGHARWRGVYFTSDRDGFVWWDYDPFTKS